MRFRYIDDAGVEHSLATIGELAEAVNAGRIGPATLLMDAVVGQWRRADSHDAVLASLHMAQSHPLGHATNADECPRPASAAEAAAPPETQAALDALEADLEAARARGIPMEALHRTYAAERERILAADAARVTAEPTGTNPWRRYWARLIDISVWTFVAGFFYVAAGAAPELLDNTWLLTILVVATWVPVEALCVSQTGRTTGKALLGLRVAARNGSPISYGTALHRAALVWSKGLGFAIPLVSVVTALVAKGRLESRGQTSWDEALGLVVRRR